MFLEVCKAQCDIPRSESDNLSAFCFKIENLKKSFPKKKPSIFCVVDKTILAKNQKTNKLT